MRAAGCFLLLWTVVWVSAQFPPGWRLFDPPVAYAAGIALLQLAAIQVGAALAFDLALRRINPPKFVSEILIVAGYGATLFGLLYRLGVNVTGIFATSAVATAVLGLALQDMLGNIAGGIALELERGIRPGDFITCDDYRGWVEHVRLRHTAIKTTDGDTVILPNSHLTKSPFSICAPLHRHYIPLTMPYSVNPQQVIDAVEFALRGSPLPGVAEDPAPRCIVRELNRSAMDYAAVVWLNRPGHEAEAISAVNTRLYFALQRAGLPATAIPHVLEMRASQTAETSDPVVTLRGTPLLRLLSDSDLFALGSHMQHVSFAPGEHIIRQGDAGSSMYFITSGTVRILYTSPDGVERQVASMAMGDFFGEGSLLTGEPRSASAVADSRVDCYRLDKEHLEEVMARGPELAEDMSIVMAHRQVELLQIRERLDEETARQREAENQTQFLFRIRRFFGLAAHGAAS